MHSASRLSIQLPKPYISLFELLKPRKPCKFPFPLGNILGGGAYAGRSAPDLQEILACPLGAKNIVDALEMNFKLDSETRKVIESIEKHFTYGKVDEGAWAPNVNNDQALEIVEKGGEKLRLHAWKGHGNGNRLCQFVILGRRKAGL